MVCAQSRRSRLRKWCSLHSYCSHSEAQAAIYIRADVSNKKTNNDSLSDIQTLRHSGAMLWRKTESIPICYAQTPYNGESMIQDLGTALTAAQAAFTLPTMDNTVARYWQQDLSSPPVRRN